MKGEAALSWPEVAAWRKAERERLIALRLSMSADERAEKSAEIIVGLNAEIAQLKSPTVSLYWPFRGEPDLRPWIEPLLESGGAVALPRVVEKGKPLEFRLYRPGDPLEKGVWNILFPAQGSVVEPDVVIAPIVGIDAKLYRLGYGGGYFDRTLSAMRKKPLVIGIGYALQRIPTIHPQPHDIPMDRVLVV